ncbi:hypothetical protein [Vreelandella aquamarina]|uniref:Uncharacterized protein n=1 Tax=Vreelandella aquamarina TaxID=77097 RepID=A0A857GMQ8_9GAMM|nr:hypothetical protein [Halomonas meridiana]QHD49834.1 hypothetical protein CTT34_09115 [Halomonas meridiana]
MSRSETDEQQHHRGLQDTQALKDLMAEVDKMATDLGDALLHEQPKSEKDAIDHEEQWHTALQQAMGRSPDPMNDWEVPINSSLPRKKDDFQKKIDNHLSIALRQIAFVSHLNQNWIPKIYENINEDNRRQLMLRDEYTKIAKSFACAYQHATAWRMLKDFRDNSPAARQEKANQAKQEIKDEKEVMLRALIKGALSKHRPSGGWERYDLAAPVIASVLHPLIQEYSLPLPDDIDLLSEKIRKLIFTEPRLRKIYNENGIQPVPEPHKMRKVNFTFR